MLRVTLLLFSRHFALRPTWAWYRSYGSVWPFSVRVGFFHSVHGNLRVVHHSSPMLDFFLLRCQPSPTIHLRIALLYGGRSFLCRGSVRASAHMLCFTCNAIFVFVPHTRLTARLVCMWWVMLCCVMAFCSSYEKRSNVPLPRAL